MVYFLRNHRRFLHGVFAVSLFASYYHLDNKPGNDHLPEMRVITVRHDRKRYA